MKPINFAYDGEVSSTRFTWHWHINSYDKKFYPINGVFEDCYYDYHAPLQTVFEKNNIPTNTITVKQALKSKEKFVYVLTFRYLRNTILQDFEYNFLLHLPIGIVQAINRGTCVLVLNDAHESALYTKEFYEQLLLNLKFSKIDKKNVILITGNPSNNITESPVNLVFWQYFETAVRLATENIGPVVFKNRFNNHDLLKKFLCLNRIPREPRYFFMYEMYKRNLLDHFNASLDKVNSVDEIISYNNNAFMDSITDKSQFNKMLLTLPWTVDTTEFKVNHWDTNNTSFAYNNLIFIVTETLVKGDAHNLFLTEKTFKPISLQMPFIVIGQPGTLSRLKELGYKTFGDFWDESYDQEFDPLFRMNKICNLVEDLSKLSTKELRSIVINTESILKHNIDLLKSRKPELSILDTILEKL
jgi:ribosomal protein S17E